MVIGHMIYRKVTLPMILSEHQNSF